MNGNRAKQARQPFRRVDEAIADRIISLLEQGDLPPWEKDWRDSLSSVPMNAISRRPYRGINVWITLMAHQTFGYKDPRWLTYRQAQSLGGHVRKGEKSTTIVFWKLVDRTSGAERDSDDRHPGGQERDRGNSFPLLRAYHVFNVEQTEDCKLEMRPEPTLETHDPLERAEAIIAGMPTPPIMETYEHSNLAPCYVPTRDTVFVPHVSRYNSIEGYYNTVFHELTHSTGHPKRLDRFGLDANANDLHAYGMEELVAGMGSAMLAAHAGIGREVVERDASYIRHWLDKIRADKPMVVTAAQKAQRATDYIIPAPATTAGADC